MFVELLEFLRCPAAHEESPLVASASRMDARHIVTGTLGCPVCGAEYPVAHGIARFGAPPRPAARVVADPEQAARLAALLDLTDARGFVVLCGVWASHVAPLRALTEVPIVLVNPPEGLDAPVEGILLTADAAPFAPGVVRALALDERLEPGLVASLTRAVRDRGRVVGAAGMPLPHTVRELARDALTWVGEKKAAPEPAPLTRIERAKPR